MTNPDKLRAKVVALIHDRESRLRGGVRLVEKPHVQAILFLRAMNARSWLTLTHLYLEIGARRERAAPSSFHKDILASALEFSASATTSLCCRKVFDHDPKRLTGAMFVKLSRPELELVAAYWAKNSSRPASTAQHTLDILKELFTFSCRSKSQLRGASSLLARRIGLLKRHADARVAHLSIDYYEFDEWDTAHVVAALAIMGAMVAEFDSATKDHDDFDCAAYEVAKELFPALACGRLFERESIAKLLNFYHGMSPREAADHISEHLPFSLGWR